MPYTELETTHSRSGGAGFNEKLMTSAEDTWILKVLVEYHSSYTWPSFQTSLSSPCF